MLSERGRIYHECLVDEGTEETTWVFTSASDLEDHWVRFWPVQDVLELRGSDLATIVGLIDSKIKLEVIFMDRFTKRKAGWTFRVPPGTGVSEQIDPQVSCIQVLDEKKLVLVQKGYPFYFKPRLYVKPVEGQDCHRIHFALTVSAPIGSSFSDVIIAFRWLDWV